MQRPNTYQRIVIEERGYDPDIWWVIEWREDSATIGDRTVRGKTAELTGIVGYSDDPVSRHYAEQDDAEDAQHDYVPMGQGPYGYLPEEDN